MNTPRIAVAALFLAATAAGAQAPSPSARMQVAMHKFDSWVGDWKGTGWSLSQAGERTEFTLTENVKSRSGGTVLLVEGRGLSSGKAPPRVTHDGVVLVYFDDKSGQFRWNGHEASSGTLDAEIKFVDGGFEWTNKVEARGTLLRFTIRLDDRHWNEVGEVSGDGTTWNRFMEMSLLRQ